MLSSARTGLAVGVAIVVLLMGQLPGCSRRAEVHEFELKAPGTFARVSITGLEQEQAEAAAAQVEQALNALENIGYTFRSGSELQRVNEALANGRTIAVSPDFLELLLKARDLSLASGGLFNPAAGNLTALWEYHCQEDDCSSGSYPDEVQKLVEQKLAGVLKRPPSMSDLVIRGNRISSRNRQVRLEFGESIRGLALDYSIRSLREAGVDNAMIEIDGNVHTTGMRGKHAWWAGVPDATGRYQVGSIETIAGESIFTVRASDTAIGKEDLIYRRIIDPRSGQPAQEVHSVTVIHGSAITANAAATAFLVAGPEHWKNVAQHMGVHAVIMITDDGTIYTSPAIEHRVHWNQGITHQHLAP
jgi:thiamine biosynthesis lipoprotein